MKVKCQTPAWLNANYEVIHVDLQKEYVVFRPLLKATWLEK